MYNFCIVFFIVFFSYVQKCLKLYQLFIIKKIKKDYTKKTCERYQNLSKEEKEKKQQYGHERYKKLSEDEKQNLVGYTKNIMEWEKMLYCNYKKAF